MLTQGRTCAELLDHLEVEILNLLVNFLRPINSNIRFRIVKPYFFPPVFFEVTIYFVVLPLKFIYGLLVWYEFFLENFIKGKIGDLKMS